MFPFPSAPHIASSLQFAARATATVYTIEVGDVFQDECLEKVQPGDSCYLEKGDHVQDGLTLTHGTADARITITGDPEACFKGSNTQDRALQIAHNYYTVEGICFDGEHRSDNVATAIYVLGAEHKEKIDVGGVEVLSSVTGLELFDLEIKNFGSECVHFRYFVTDSHVQGCTIQHCGIEDFEGGGGGKVGEAIYVGTALDQVGDGKVRAKARREGGGGGCMCAGWLTLFFCTVGRAEFSYQKYLCRVVSCRATRSLASAFWCVSIHTRYIIPSFGVFFIYIRINGEIMKLEISSCRVQQQYAWLVFANLCYFLPVFIYEPLLVLYEYKI